MNEALEPPTMKVTKTVTVVRTETHETHFTMAQITDILKKQAGAPASAVVCFDLNRYGDLGDYTSVTWSNTTSTEENE